jgi:two-component system, sensor histidine kinase and response regulator
VIAVCSQAMDITERKQAAEAIRSSEAQLRLLLDSAAEAIYGIDVLGNCTFCNPSCLALLGYTTADQLIGKNMHQLAHHSHADGTPFPEQASEIYQAFKNGMNAHVDKEVLWRANGTSFPAEYWSHPQLHDSVAVGAVVSFLDITERKQANEKLLKLSRAVENSPASVVITGLDGTIEYVNRRFIEVTGYTAIEAIGQNPRMLKSGIQEPEFYTNMWETILSGKVWQGELNNKNKQGEIYLEAVSISPIHNEQGAISHFVAVKEDITLRKQTELELQKARLDADSANQAKSDFLANMSHEIRTPMNAIIGLSHLCLQTELTEKQTDYLQKVHGSAKSLLGIINDILEFSKIEACKMDVEHVIFKLEDVMSNLATIVSTKIEEKGLEFLIDTSLDVPNHLIGDPLRLGQVLINLAGNAIKFTQQGEVLVLTEVAQETEHDISLRFTVLDSGIGMTEQQIGKLFHAFTQADTTTTRKFGGTGLGLSISKQLVGLMNGEIWTESIPGTGSKFIFTASFQKVAKHPGNKSCYPVEDLRGMRVLAVDDNASSRRILKSYLESCTYDVSVAAGGAAALQAIMQADREGKPFRLVVIDWKMPQMDGFSAAQKIHEMTGLSKAPKILLLTGHNEMQRHVAGDMINGQLSKPFQRSELFEASIEVFGCVRTRPSAALPLFRPDLVRMLSGAHLLLVEDNEINQMVARELLEKAGVLVCIAANGVEALARLAEERFDGVLMDIQMPVMDGLTATKEIRKQPALADLPIIAMTANIAKPFDPNQMVAVLAKWITPARHAAVDMNATPALNDTADLPQLPGVQVSDALLRVGDNIATYWIVLEKFLNSQQGTLHEIALAIETDDWKTAERLAHTLKGLLGTLGAGALRNQLAAFEAAIVNRENIRVAAQMKSIDIELAQLFADIDRALCLRKTANDSVHTPIDIQALQSLFLQARLQLEKFDSRVDDTVLLIRRMVSGDALMKKTAASLELCISRYDYEQALLELNAWAASIHSTDYRESQS